MSVRRVCAVALLLAASGRAPLSGQAASAAASVVGTWSGALEAGGVQLLVVFHLRAGPDGTLSGTMDSPDQGATGIPVTAVAVEDHTVRLEVAGGAGIFAGMLDSAETRLTGEWRQRGAAIPLILERGTAGPERSRPQEPVPPFPYRVDSVTIPTTDPGVRLAGTLVRPRGAGPFPTAVLLSGSGPQDRDETAFGHRPFLVLADYLARHGIATLRYDDRGVGGSTGAYWSATTRDFAADAAAALRLLRATPDVDPERVGLIGHSQGGVTAAIAAAADPAVAFVVALSTPGLPGGRLLVERQVDAARRNGAPDSLVDWLVRLRERSFELVRHAPDRSQTAGDVEALLARELQRLSPGERDMIGMEGDDPALAARQTARLMATPWFRFFLDFDPAEAFQAVRVPVLLVAGGLDRQVPAARSLRALCTALGRAGNREAVSVLVPRANHLLQSAETGEPAEYAAISETIQPEVLATVGQWIGTDRGSATSGRAAPWSRPC